MDFKTFFENNNLLAWFGNSKVVNAQGKPQRVFHGTPNLGFTKFNLNSPRTTSHESGGLGIWFTSNAGVADNFAKKTDTIYEPHPTEKWPDGEPKVYAKDVDKVGGTYAVYLKIENPLILGIKKDGFEEMMDLRDRFAEYINGTKGVEGFWKRKYIATNPKQTNEDFLNYLKSQGYDGIIMNHTKWDAVNGKRHTQYVVFSPSQVKSAVGNTKFNPNSEDIGENTILK